jgi:hypothetical protein
MILTGIWRFISDDEIDFPLKARTSELAFSLANDVKLVFGPLYVSTTLQNNL